MWLDNLRTMKDHSGMTTKEISKQSGIPEPTLEKLFAGATKDPKLPTMQKLVHFLGYTLDDLDGISSKAKNSPPYSSEARKLADAYDNKLDNWGRQAVRELVETEIARCESEDSKEVRALPTLDREADEFAALAREQYLSEKKPDAPVSSVKESDAI